MSITDRLARLSPAERRLLPRLALLLAAIRVSLWLVPFALVRRLLRQRWLSAAFPPDLVDATGERLAWAVRVASRPVPAATCLTQSLALQFLLKRSGRSSSLRIGVAKSEQSGFVAHAWIDHGGRTLPDRPEDIACYTPLASWKDT